MYKIKPMRFMSRLTVAMITHYQSSGSLNLHSSLSVCTILTTGRTGSDFFQSLMDSHEQVLTFNGYFQFHLF